MFIAVVTAMGGGTTANGGREGRHPPLKEDTHPLWVVGEILGVDLSYFGDIFIMLDWNLNHGIIHFPLYKYKQ